MDSHHGSRATIDESHRFEMSMARALHTRQMMDSKPPASSDEALAGVDGFDDSYWVAICTESRDVLHNTVNDVKSDTSAGVCFTAWIWNKHCFFLNKAYVVISNLAFFLIGMHTSVQSLSLGDEVLLHGMSLAFCLTNWSLPPYFAYYMCGIKCLIYPEPILIPKPNVCGTKRNNSTMF